MTLQVVDQSLIIINQDLVQAKLDTPSIRKVEPEYTIDSTDFIESVVGGKLQYAENNSIEASDRYHYFQSNILMNGGLKAYASHVGYELTPDQLWFMIVDTLAAVINNDPGNYSHLIDPTWTPGVKKKVEVRNDNQTLNGEWLTSIGMFEDKLKEFIPAQTQQVFTTNFTTSNRFAELSKLLCLMDAGSSFFSYGVTTMCGVEAVRVKGTAQDYQKIINNLTWVELHFGDKLEFWINKIRPVLHSIVDTFNGNTSQKFWGDMIKVDNLGGSGSPSLNGWLGYFTGYTSDMDYSTKTAFKRIKSEGEYTYWDTSDIPSHITSVPFVWNNNGNKIDMKFVGGPLGVSYDGSYLIPEFGIGVATV